MKKIEMKILLLDENSKESGIQNYTLRALGNGAWEHKDIGIFKLHVGSLKPQDVLDEIAKVQPDAIVWTSTNMLHLIGVFPKTLPKYVMWHDDPLPRIWGCRTSKAQIDLMAGTDYTHLVGDSAWGDELNQRYGFFCKWFPLAYDPDEFPICNQPITDDVCFVGTLQSPRAIQLAIEAMPPLPKAVVSQCKRFYEHDVYAFNGDKTPSVHDAIINGSFHRHWDEYVQANGPGVMLAYNTIWSIAKNRRRVEVLQAILKDNPLRIFSEMKQNGHANDTEIRAMLGEWGNRLQICDTSGMAPTSLYQVYHYGKFHIDICDSQNLHDGFAYRYFQTVGSGRPLMVDALPGHCKVFDPEDCTMWTDKKSLSWWNCDPLHWIANKGKEYTWQRRMEQLVEMIQKKRDLPLLDEIENLAPEKR